jgi:streptogramin lyase
MANGLARYDGYTSTYFRHNSRDSTSLAGNLIYSVFEDSKSRLWVGTGGHGVDVSDPAKRKFQRVRLVHDSFDLRQHNIMSIAEDAEGRIWMAAHYGVIVIREENDSFYRVPLESMLNGPIDATLPKRPGWVLKALNGDIWIAGANGLFRYEMKSKRLITPDQFAGLPHLPVRGMCYDRNGKFWVCLDQRGDKLYHFDPNTSSFTLFCGIPFHPRFGGGAFSFDLDNRLWISIFGDQVYGYDFRDSTCFLISTENTNITHERFTRDPFIDHSGMVWLPSEGFLTLPYPKGFHGYIHPFSFHQSVNGIDGHRDDLWIYYREKGIIRLTSDNDRITHWTTDPEGDILTSVDHFADQVRLRSGRMIFIGFELVMVCDPDGRNMKEFPIMGTNRAAYQDSKGRIWVGSIGGLILFDEEKGPVKTYRLPARMGDSRNFVQSILEDRMGNIWFASSKGLVMLNPETEEVIQFMPEGDPAYSFPSFTVLDLSMDATHRIWAGTDIGLVRMDPVSYQWKLFDHSFGITNDYICAVVAHPDGEIWVSTNMGISCFNPEAETFTNYNVNDGLLSRNYTERAKHLTDDGWIYFGGTDGLDYFHPRNLRTNALAPVMYLVDFHTVRKGEQKQFPLSADEYRLSYLDDLIEIEVSGLFYTEQQSVRYQYRMEPIHEDWVDLGNERKVLFSNLKPGRYTFKAKAITPDGIASATDIEIPIYVKPPFIQTTWFRIVAILALASGVFAFINIVNETSNEGNKQRWKFSIRSWNWKKGRSRRR